MANKTAKTADNAETKSTKVKKAAAPKATEKKCCAKKCATKTAEKKETVKKKETAMGKKVKFVFNGKPGSKVFLVGSFNGWEEDKKQLSDKKNTGEYSCTCVIKHGHYEYKFLVDGIWMMDSNNPNFVKNAFGSLNNVLDV